MHRAQGEASGAQNSGSRVLAECPPRGPGASHCLTGPGRATGKHSLVQRKEVCSGENGCTCQESVRCRWHLRPVAAPASVACVLARPAALKDSVSSPRREDYRSMSSWDRGAASRHGPGPSGCRDTPKTHSAALGSQTPESPGLWGGAAHGKGRSYILFLLRWTCVRQLSSLLVPCDECLSCAVFAS